MTASTSMGASGRLAEGGPPARFALKNNGDGTFTDVTEAGGLLRFHPTRPLVGLTSTGMLARPVHRQRVPGSKDPDRCELFRNNGNGTFHRVCAGMRHQRRGLRQGSGLCRLRS